MSDKKIIITPLAESHLQEIVDYISTHSYLEYAQKILKQIQEKIHQLSLFPKAGQGRDDLLPGVRQQVVGRYLIFYQERENAIYVLAIVHGSRDLQRFFAS